MGHKKSDSAQWRADHEAWLRQSTAFAKEMAEWPSVVDMIRAGLLEGKQLPLRQRIFCSRCKILMPVTKTGRCDECEEYLKYKPKSGVIASAVGSLGIPKKAIADAPDKRRPVWSTDKCRRCEGPLTWIESTYGYCDECRVYMEQ